MTINTNLNKSTPSNFELVLSKFPTEVDITPNKELTLNIYGTVIPSVNISTLYAYWQGAKTTQDGEVQFTDWIVNYTVDSNFDNWQILYKWLTYVKNNKDKMGEDPLKYAISASMVVTDNFRRRVLTVNFGNVWLMDLGEVSFSHRDYDVNLESTITLMYDYYTLGT
jgi:hypothetical protein